MAYLNKPYRQCSGHPLRPPRSVPSESTADTAPMCFHELSRSCSERPATTFCATIAFARESHFLACLMVDVFLSYARGESGLEHAISAMLRPPSWPTPGSVPVGVLPILS